MQWMFSDTTAFNQDLSNWDVGQVTNMAHMFYRAILFDQDLSKWNVATITGMQAMFREAIAFNQDLSKWNVGRVTDMRTMFRGATSFKQVLCGDAWVNSKADKADMFMDSPGSIANQVCSPSQSSFQPENKDDLVGAVDECLQVFP